MRCVRSYQPVQQLINSFSYRAVKVSSPVERMAEKTTQRRDSTETLGQRGEKLTIAWVYPDANGRVTALASGRTVLGRDFTCDIRLEGDQTSRRHAEIIKESAMVFIADLN